MSLNKNIENLQSALSSLERKVADVYEAGKQDEYNRLVDETKIIEKTVSGTLIRVDDVSEIPHKCTISVDADATVAVCGKNLLKPLSTTTLVGVTATMDADGTIHLNGTATANAWFYLDAPVRLPIASYVLSVHNDTVPDTALQNIGFANRDGTHTVTSIRYVRNGFVSAAGKAINRVEFCVPSGTTINDATMQIQLELGTVKSNYEAYKVKSYTVTPSDSIEVDSLCPTMTLVGTNDTNITLDYHKSWGMQTEYDRFWDAFQDYGNRTNYDSSIRNIGWNDTTFNPKYPLKMEDANGGREVFAAAKITSVKVPIYAKNTRLTYTFTNCANLKTIPLLKMEGVYEINNCFYNCSSLENLTIGGVIEKNGFNVSPCTKLTHESLMSIINALACVTAIWTKTSTVYTPQSEQFMIGSSLTEGAEYFGRAFTTTGEEVLLYWDGFDENYGGMRMGYVCEVDGVYYICNPAANPNTYTLTLGTTNLAKLEDWEKETATSKGWTLA